MMGKQHAMSGAAGWLAGCAVLDAAGHPVALHVRTIGAAVCAGWALIPDLDHPESTVSRYAGPITRYLAEAVAELSRVVHDRTRTAWDRPGLGGHRLLTHTAVWAILCGVVVAAAGRWAGPYLAAALVFVSAHLGLRTTLPWRWQRIQIRTGPRRRRMRISVPVLVPAGFAVFTFVQAPGSAWWLGLAVAAGSLIHCLGDAPTNSACPIVAPVPVPVLRRDSTGRRRIVGWRRWHPVGPPKTVTVRAGSWSATVKTRFNTGGLFEQYVVRPLLITAIAGSVAWMEWPTLADAVTTIQSSWSTPGP
jgi:membrane-bound metal-dependent hydrolase YbcI (DUF457 family)